MRDGYVYNNVSTILNAYVYKGMLRFSEIADALDHPDDATHYRNLAKELRDAMNRHLFDASRGMWRDGFGIDHFAWHSSVFPMAFGCPNSTHAKPTFDYILSRVTKEGGMPGNVY